jgi:hypothetical protein
MPSYDTYIIILYIYVSVSNTQLRAHETDS